MTKNKKIKAAIRAKAEAQNVSYQALRMAGASKASNDTDEPEGRFLRIVRRTIELARAHAVDYESSRFERGRPVMQLQRREIEQALVEYLESSNEADLYKLVTVMYCGRDREAFNRVYEHNYRTFKTPDQVIIQMVEKSPLAEYLERGLVESVRQGIDIEAARVSILGPETQLQAFRALQRNSHQLAESVRSTIGMIARHGRHTDALEPLFQALDEAQAGLDLEFDRVMGRMRRGETLEEDDAGLEMAQRDFYAAIEALQVTQARLTRK